MEPHRAEHTDSNEETSWARPRVGRRMLVLASVSLGSFLCVSTAYARPEPIPPPVETPEPGESPGTGQAAPLDPQEPPPIEPPEGFACTEEEEGEEPEEEICDPEHPGGPEGQLPDNTPGPAWYSDMAAQMYGFQQALDGMATWSYSYDSYIYYYSMWTMSVVQQYYHLGYNPDGTPHEYPYGLMTRGDYNYYFYYWVRPIYYSLLYYSAQYYSSHQGSPQAPYYLNHLSDMASSYQSLVLCNYGFNGDDKGSREDLYAQSLQQQAGL